MEIMEYNLFFKSMKIFDFYKSINVQTKKKLLPAQFMKLVSEY